jgi:hypothetical protein
MNVARRCQNLCKLRLIESNIYNDLLKDYGRSGGGRTLIGCLPEAGGADGVGALPEPLKEEIVCSGSRLPPGTRVYCWLFFVQSGNI